MLKRHFNFALFRQLHLWVGLISLVVFILSGQYMHWGYDHLKGMADSPRMMFRSAHIYLLWSALLNALLGLYLRLPGKRWVKILQGLGSLAILLGPPLLVMAFVAEPWLSDLARPYARPAIYLAFGGTIAHLISGFAQPSMD